MTFERAPAPEGQLAHLYLNTRAISVGGPENTRVAVTLGAWTGVDISCGAAWALATEQILRFMVRALRWTSVGHGAD